MTQEMAAEIAKEELEINKAEQIILEIIQQEYMPAVLSTIRRLAADRHVANVYFHEALHRLCEGGNPTLRTHLLYGDVWLERAPAPIPETNTAWRSVYEPRRNESEGGK